MLVELLSSIVAFVCALLAVAFFTLLERKGLGYFQLRKGPNKVGLMGLPQPLADAIKLFSKELIKPTLVNVFPFLICPFMSLFLGLVLWILYNNYFVCNMGGLSMLLFLCVSSLGVYSVMGAGWFSNSKYALLGSVRAVAQSISYEVSMSLILLSCLLLAGSMSLSLIMKYQVWVWVVFVNFFMMIMWFVSCVAETHRAPFDFAEGESELVSGFNVEYGGVGFAVLFMAEYSNILFMSVLVVSLFFGGVIFISMYGMGLCLFVSLVAWLFIWVRASYPRYRYDLLMYLIWKSYLPSVLNILVFLVSFICLMN
uniref:NADH-ubiquinone oxidoreductase chain 1 n=2 Tax=Ommastrephidae TaxID=6626 RepID=B2MYV9_STHOU|nr:NADH dehydrogenase subunit 1 [Sthenoteuthis oualaniensis]ACC78192.1 NADH dehydrogenase subunit 1 [Sthenoteuthis oualaniensis]ANG44477.1 NADH dehydrogenase subunit 1 [Sthenoteuthis oualaniensis]QNS38527.1 NADH dehydrogenase subunit 1 [Sthenoteuthis oualaniensis]